MAILGDNPTKHPIKIQFKDLSKINKNYAAFDAIGMMRNNRLYIYINKEHKQVSPGALAALIAREAVYQDTYDSKNEEVYATMIEAKVWVEILNKYPESDDNSSLVTKRENILKMLL